MRIVILWQKMENSHENGQNNRLGIPVLAALSFTSGVEESFAGVATPGAVTLALAGSHDGAIDQVRWGGGRGWGRPRLGRSSMGRRRLGLPAGMGTRLWLGRRLRLGRLRLGRILWWLLALGTLGSRLGLLRPSLWRTRTTEYRRRAPRGARSRLETDAQAASPQALSAHYRDARRGARHGGRASPAVRDPVGNAVLRR